MCKYSPNLRQNRTILPTSRININPQFRCFVILLLTVCIVFPSYSPAYADNSATYISPTRKRVRTSTDVFLVAIPAAAIATTIIEQDWEGLKQGAFSAATTIGATMILKYAIKENRPDFSNHHSFPSGHASVTFAASTYIARRYGWKYAIPAYALSTYTAWGRVYGRKHHWWDVVTGAAIGTASSLIFTRPWMQKHDAALVPLVTDDAIGLTASLSF